ncbi:uncharacterized protein [Nicotiana sylvestris]|uniref:uncharacterized protein n=1 Tax=Nicotiana sylvestris TaxID=4096 RepID=UPI00388C5EE2
MVLALVAPLPTQPSRGRGQTTRGGGQAVRGGGQPVRGRPRGGGQIGGAQPRCYVFPAIPEAKSFDAVIIGSVMVFHRDASVLFDPSSTYSYVLSYFNSYLDMSCDSLSTPIYVSMPIGDSIMVDQVYHACFVTIRSCETRVDLLFLNMMDFDVILGMDWLSPYHATLDCHAKIMTLAMLGLPRLEWRRTLGHSTTKSISYVMARRMDEKRCLVYLAYICDSSAEVLSMDSVPVVREFPEVFLTDLLGIPP